MKTAKVRVSESTWERMEQILFSRYPDKEAATFLQCSFVEGSNDLVVLIRDVIAPKEGDVDSEVSLVGLNEKYSLRCALESEKNKFSVGLIHSHPEGYATYPSRIDDDMDGYYEEYFRSFVPDRPYISLITSKDENGDLRFSGRIFYKGKWILCSHIQIVGHRNQIVVADNVEEKKIPQEILDQLERLTGAMGVTSARKLWRSQVVIVGGGGTGSALFHSLVRSCVGRIVIVDPDYISISNAERVHGYRFGDFGKTPVYKVDILKRLAVEINPKVEVIAVNKNVTDEEVQKYIVGSDFIFGCTDSQVGRAFISDIAIRFLLPAIHVNVSMVPKKNRIESEIIHLTQYGPTLPCAYCRDQIDGQKLAQELMPEEERSQRKEAEKKSTALKGTYWVDEPVLHTVGSLTTAAAELVANFGVGFITGTLDMPAQFLEIDIVQIHKGATIVPMKRRSKCICSGRDGMGFLAAPWIGFR